ncbi:MAG: hypothetical protein HY260_07745 [Chloroflexi bacterium]|nr:hypothetical protein [Chloroflexota bacterium]
MIRHDTLLKNARDLADQRAELRPSIVAIYVAGSVARGEPPFGGATDIDLIVVDNPSGGALPEPEDVRLSSEIVAEITYRRPDFFRDTPALRDHHYLGPEIAEGLALHDPRHFFERVQAGVRGRFDGPPHVFARARSSLEWARGELDAILPWLETSRPESPTLDQIRRLAGALQFAATAVLVLNRVPASIRRLMLRLSETAETFGRPDLYSKFAHALNADSLTPDEVEALLSIWATLFDAAEEFHQSDWGEDFFIQPVRRNYCERAMKTLAAEGRERDTAWLLLHAGAACANQIQLHAPPGAANLYFEKWQRLLERFGLGSTADFAQAVGLARDYLEAVSDFVDDWGVKEGA